MLLGEVLDAGDAILAADVEAASVEGGPPRSGRLRGVHGGVRNRRLHPVRVRIVVELGYLYFSCDIQRSNCAIAHCR